MSDNAIEQEIQAKGLTAPRVTPADIEANIACIHYFRASDAIIGKAMLDQGEEDFTPPQVHRSTALLTFCVIVLKNGFVVTGESACASPENFDMGLGQKIARENAISKIWPLMGYALKQTLN